MFVQLNGSKEPAHACISSEIARTALQTDPFNPREVVELAGLREAGWEGERVRRTGVCPMENHDHGLGRVWRRWDQGEARGEKSPAAFASAMAL